MVQIVQLKPASFGRGETFITVAILYVIGYVSEHVREVDHSFTDP